MKRRQDAMTQTYLLTFPWPWGSLSLNFFCTSWKWLRHFSLITDSSSSISRRDCVDACESRLDTLLITLSRLSIWLRFPINTHAHLEQQDKPYWRKLAEWYVGSESFTHSTTGLVKQFQKSQCHPSYIVWSFIHGVILHILCYPLCTVLSLVYSVILSM